MSKSPTHDVCLAGDSYGVDKRVWSNIGVAWLNEDGGLNLKIHFPCPIIVDRTTEIRLFKREVRGG